MTAIHNACLAQAKSSDEASKDCMALSICMSNFKDWLDAGYGEQLDFQVLSKTVQQTVDFIQLQERLRKEALARLAEVMSGPIHNFLKLELKDALMARKVADRQYGKVTKDANAKQQFNYACARIQECEQKSRIYLVEKFVEYIETNHYLCRQVAAHVEQNASTLKQYLMHIEDLKDQYRATHPEGCGSVLQGSSVSLIKCPTFACASSGQPAITPGEIQKEKMKELEKTPVAHNPLALTRARKEDLLKKQMGETTAVFEEKRTVEETRVEASSSTNTVPAINIAQADGGGQQQQQQPGYGYNYPGSFYYPGSYYGQQQALTPDVQKQMQEYAQAYQSSMQSMYMTPEQQQQYAQYAQSFYTPASPLPSPRPPGGGDEAK